MLRRGTGEFKILLAAFEAKFGRRHCPVASDYHCRGCGRGCTGCAAH